MELKMDALPKIEEATCRNRRVGGCRVGGLPRDEGMEFPALEDELHDMSGVCGAFRKTVFPSPVQ